MGAELDISWDIKYIFEGGLLMERNRNKIILLNIKVLFFVFCKTQQCLTIKKVLGEIWAEGGNSRVGLLAKK